MNEPGKRHILIEGDRQVGKSTLIRKVLDKKGLPLYGFFTKSISIGEDGTHEIYIHPAEVPESERRYTEENRIAVCNKTRERMINSKAFDGPGMRYLSEIKDDGIIVMDELGFMEKDSPGFMNRILELMDGDVHIIAAIKDRTDIPFINELREKPKAQIFKINKENRDDLYETVLNAVKDW